MTSTDLKALQERIKFDAVSMACCLGISHDQYRHYVYGNSKIPSNIERAALELEAINVTFMEERYSPGGKFDQIIDILHPHGILSELSP